MIVMVELIRITGVDKNARIMTFFALPRRAYQSRHYSVNLTLTQ